PLRAWTDTSAPLSTPPLLGGFPKEPNLGSALPITKRGPLCEPLAARMWTISRLRSGSSSDRRNDESIRPTVVRRAIESGRSLLEGFLRCVDERHHLS